MLDVLLYMCNCYDMKTVDQIFTELGGTAKAAILLGVNQTTASAMRTRNVVRVCYWPTLVRVCREKRIRGVNYNSLVQIHQGKKQ